MTTLNLKKEKNEALDKVYTGNRKDLRQIKKPTLKQSSSNNISKIIFVIALAVIIIGAYFLFFNDSNEGDNKYINWYSVKLVNGEIYFGQVENLDSDPVNLRNVYYNYDQKKGDINIEEEKNLRLVKRGQETHGPTGDMNIIRSQILYLEPLKDDSKVLNAILNYEN